MYQVSRNIFLQEERLRHYIQPDQPRDSGENRRRSARGADGEVKPEPGSISCTTVFTSHNLSLCVAVCTSRHPYRDQ
ncbi:hypothetical protein BGY98DRAFT_710976 [Russula aff. rugulosa BPL654]|nr:hypothetical protein BGY98DRAFT_710976 [Russula aff. rugulosa BPL654]